MAKQPVNYCPYVSWERERNFDLWLDYVISAKCYDLEREDERVEQPFTSTHKHNHIHNNLIEYDVILFDNYIYFMNYRVILIVILKKMKWKIIQDFYYIFCG